MQQTGKRDPFGNRIIVEIERVSRVAKGDVDEIVVLGDDNDDGMDVERERREDGEFS